MTDQTTATALSHRQEPADIRWMRRCFARWPLSRGKGVLMRGFQPLLGERRFHFEIEPDVFIPGTLDDYMIRALFMHTLACASAWRFSRRLLRTGDTVVDIGAHIGLWLMGAARRVGPAGIVHAFEPVAENYVRLCENLAANRLGWVRTQQTAVSDSCGSVFMYAASHGNSAGASMAQRQGIDRQAATEVTTLDRYCEGQGIRRVHFLKVDVEGAEWLVFRGAVRLLGAAEAPAMMFESGESLAGPLNSSSPKVKALLKDYGYEIYRYDGKRLEPVAVEQCHVCDDLFAFKPAHFERHPFLRTVTDGPLP